MIEETTYQSNISNDEKDVNNHNIKLNAKLKF